MSDITVSVTESPITIVATPSGGPTVTLTVPATVTVSVSPTGAQGPGYPDISTTLTRDEDGKVSVITTASGTRTITRNESGQVASITGTGIYPNKTITRNESGQVVSVTVED